jgi:hypothetical protein
VNRSADDAQLTADPVSLKPETSTENPTLEFFGAPLSILFGVFRVVQSVLPINTGFIWQGGTQHDALRRDLENIFVPRLIRRNRCRLLPHGSMANLLISCVMVFLRRIERRMNGKPEEVNAWENATHTQSRLGAKW